MPGWQLLLPPGALLGGPCSRASLPFLPTALGEVAVSPSFYLCIVSEDLFEDYRSQYTNIRLLSFVVIRSCKVPGTLHG